MEEVKEKKLYEATIKHLMTNISLAETINVLRMHLEDSISKELSEMSEEDKEKHYLNFFPDEETSVIIH